MPDKRLEQFDHIVRMGKEGQEALNKYWLDFELYTSFEYWLMAALLIGPLIYLFLKSIKTKFFSLASMVTVFM